MLCSASQRLSRWASGCSTSWGKSARTGHTNWLARQGSFWGAPSRGAAPSTRAFTIRRSWLPGKGNRMLAAMPPSPMASCSPSQRLVGQVLTTTCTCSKGPGGASRS